MNRFLTARRASTILIKGLFFFFFIGMMSAQTALPWIQEFGDFPSGLDRTRWETAEGVYLNNHLAVMPPSVGFVTFDGRDDQTNRYPNDAIFDQLVTVPLDMSQYKGEQIHIAFYLEFGGYGRTPIIGTSLTDEFNCDGKNDQGQWVNLKNVVRIRPDEEFSWYSAILDDQFLHDDFQLRFWSSGTQSRGFARMWHLDYITIDRGEAFPYFLDVSFSERPSSFLKRYRSMPFSQFITWPEDFESEQINYIFHNHFPYEQNVVQDRVVVTDELSGEVVLDTLPFLRKVPEVPQSQNFLIPGISTVQNPFRRELITEQLMQLDRNGSYVLNFDYDFFQDEEEILRYPSILENNKVQQTIHFEDYFAYDDGSAERVEIVLATRESALRPQFALEYVLQAPDQIVGIEYLIPADGMDPEQTFTGDLKVWLDELDDDAEYVFENVTLEPSPNPDSDTRRLLFTDLGMSGITTEAQRYYVGFQLGDDRGKDFKFGMDMSNPEAADYLFYRGRESSEWESYPRSAGLTGAIMLRLVVANDPDFTSSTNDVESTTHEYSFYPNPTRDFLRIEGYSTDDDLMLSVADPMGRVVWVGELSWDELDVSFLNPGIYFFTLISPEDASSETHKIFIK